MRAVVIQSLQGNSILLTNCMWPFKWNLCTESAQLATFRQENV